MGKAATWNTLDYFVVESSLARGIQSITADFTFTPAPHIPADLVFHEALEAQQALVFVEPQAIPNKPAPPTEIGCQAPPLSYDADVARYKKVLEAIEAAEQLPFNASAAALQKAVTRVYAAWADQAEEDLAVITGTKLKEKGHRGMRAKLE